MYKGVNKVSVDNGSSVKETCTEDCASFFSFLLWLPIGYFR